MSRSGEPVVVPIQAQTNVFVASTTSTGSKSEFVPSVAAPLLSGAAADQFTPPSVLREKRMSWSLPIVPPNVLVETHAHTQLPSESTAICGVPSCAVPSVAIDATSNAAAVQF